MVKAGGRFGECSDLRDGRGARLEGVLLGKRRKKKEQERDWLSF